MSSTNVVLVRFNLSSQVCARAASPNWFRFSGPREEQGLSKIPLSSAKKQSSGSKPFSRPRCLHFLFGQPSRARTLAAHNLDFLPSFGRNRSRTGQLNGPQHTRRLTESAKLSSAGSLNQKYNPPNNVTHLSRGYRNTNLHADPNILLEVNNNNLAAQGPSSTWLAPNVGVFRQARSQPKVPTPYARSCE